MTNNKRISLIYSLIYRYCYKMNDICNYSTKELQYMYNKLRLLDINYTLNTGKRPNVIHIGTGASNPSDKISEIKKNVRAVKKF